MMWQGLKRDGVASVCLIYPILNFVGGQQVAEIFDIARYDACRQLRWL
jgi:hypothetical protein